MSSDKYSCARAPPSSGHRAARSTCTGMCICGMRSTHLWDQNHVPDDYCPRTVEALLANLAAVQRMLLTQQHPSGSPTCADVRSQPFEACTVEQSIHHHTAAYCMPLKYFPLSAHSLPHAAQSLTSAALSGALSSCVKKERVNSATARASRSVAQAPPRSTGVPSPSPKAGGPSISSRRPVASAYGRAWTIDAAATATATAIATATATAA